jgi:hypothetical protein
MQPLRRFRLLRLRADSKAFARGRKRLGTEPAALVHCVPAALDPTSEHDWGVFIFAGYSFEWRVEYCDKGGTGTSADPADPDKTFRVLTPYAVDDLLGWRLLHKENQNSAWNVAAPECTMAGKRIVVCALQAMRCKQIGVSMGASAQVASGAPGIVASDCRTHGGSRFRLLKSVGAVLPKGTVSFPTS